MLILKVIRVAFITGIVQFQRFKEVILSYFPMEREVCYVIREALNSESMQKLLTCILKVTVLSLLFN